MRFPSVRSRVIACLALALGALVLVYGPGAASAKHKHKHPPKHCPRTAITVKIKGKRYCASKRAFAHPPKKATEKLFNALAAPTRVGHRKLRLAPRVKGESAAVMAGLARLGVTAASAHASDEVTEPGPKVDGWSTTIHYDGHEATVEAKKGDVTAKVTEVNTYDPAPCPDGAGDIAGTRTWSMGITEEVALPKGLSARVRFEMREDGKVTGHSNDQADFQDFDLDERFREHGQVALIGANGRVVETSPPRVYSFEYTKNHIPPNVHFDAALFNGVQTSHIVVPRGSEGLTFLGITVRQQDPALDKMNEWASWQFYLTAKKVSERLQEDRDHHWRDRDCVTLAAAADRTTLAPGETMDVTVTPTTSVPSQTPLVLTASTSGGSISPSQTTVKPGQQAHLTFTAPTNDNWTAQVTVKAVSKQGSGVTSIGFQSSPAPTDAFVKVVEIDGTMDYTAHYPANRYQGDTCTIAGEEKYSLALPSGGSGQATDGDLAPSGGFITAPETLIGTVDYSSTPCAFGHGTDSSCHDDLNDDGLLAVLVSHDDGAPTADVSLTAYGRDINDFFCHDEFADDWVQGDNQPLSETVPWSELTGPGSSELDFSQDVNDGQREVKRQLTVVLEAVNQDGSPR